MTRNLATSHNSMKTSAAAMLYGSMARANSLVCCGLDPDIRRFPAELISTIHSQDDQVVSFLEQIIDITIDHVCAYKAQKAFFDKLPNGHKVLGHIIDYVHKKN